MQLRLLLHDAPTSQDKTKGKPPFLKQFLNGLRLGKRAPVLVSLTSVLVVSNYWRSKNLCAVDSELGGFQQKRDQFSSAECDQRYLVKFVER
jgi:hypothetical protein